MSSSARTDDVATSVLTALGNKYSAEILCAARTPTSAQDLSDELGVPIATCYRRIEELESVGLLQCEGRQLSDEGRRTNVYRRTLDEFAIEFTGDKPDLSTEDRSAAKNQIQEQMD
ncbi:helix-turn-helix domain-containing protein [Halorubellus sp. PRR65]|uniref:helix-turn-helix domain-containing protein n=1 Tax=Halorubellus sp. PRR65 TaxID=3098148 RepID=UPI002B25F115|nr:helix-turn-helix domain-containing protein [Halorubellus sp. PRR65]